MSREHILVVLGTLTLVSPFVGMPVSWFSAALPILGFLTLAIGVSLVIRRRHVSIHEETSLGSTHE